MKELSTEEKAKRYDEAIERARTEYKNHEAFKGFCEMLVNIFPELAESEDERIRKSIIYALRNGGFYNNDKMDEAIAWLEKQGEKPQGKTALDVLNEKKVDNANKVEPKFKV